MKLLRERQSLAELRVIREIAAGRRKQTRQPDRLIAICRNQSRNDETIKLKWVTAKDLNPDMYVKDLNPDMYVNGKNRRNVPCVNFVGVKFF